MGKVDGATTTFRSGGVMVTLTVIGLILSLVQVLLAMRRK